MSNHDQSLPVPDPTTPTRRRRATVLGVSAGVLGGGLVGLAMTVPTFTSAASDDVGDDAIVTLQDTDTSTDTSTDGDTENDTGSDPADGRPEPGEHLRALLQDLVDDGTITAAQADAVAEHLVEHRPEGRRGERGHRPGMDGEVVAELLGIDAAELREALRDGASIADLATADGVDVQVVIDALVDEATGHLDLAVEDGRLTEDEAADKLVDLTERITARVNGDRPARG